MNRLEAARRAQVIRCLIEGCSAFLDVTMRDLNCQKLQADEAWSFCYCKQRNPTSEIVEERVAGDVRVWAAIDADTKLIPCWLLGKRDGGCATEFIQDLAGRLTNRVQLTTDGLVLLCYKRSEQQKGQQGSCWSRARAIRMRSVAMDCGLCRSARTRRAAGLEVGRNLRGA